MLDRDQAYEYILVAITVWREGRGEDFQTKLAIAWSIRNRVLKPGKTWWGDDWEEVVLKKYQYSSFNHDDPNAVKWPLPGDASWEDAKQAAERAYLGYGTDPSKGATHYYDDSMKADPPQWAKTAEFKVKLGRVNFFKAA